MRSKLFNHILQHFSNYSTSAGQHFPGNPFTINANIKNINFSQNNSQVLLLPLEDIWLFKENEMSELKLLLDPESNMIPSTEFGKLLQILLEQNCIFSIKLFIVDNYIVNVNPSFKKYTSEGIFLYGSNYKKINETLMWDSPKLTKLGTELISINEPCGFRSVLTSYINLNKNGITKDFNEIEYQIFNLVDSALFHSNINVYNERYWISDNMRKNIILSINNEKFLTDGNYNSFKIINPYTSSNKNGLLLRAGWKTSTRRFLSTKIDNYLRKMDLIKQGGISQPTYDLVHKENKCVNIIPYVPPFLAIDVKKNNDYKFDFIIKSNKYGWNTFSSGIFYPLFSVKDLYKELKLFYNFFKINYKSYNYFAFIFKIRFDNNDIRSCSTTQISDKNGIDELHNILSQVFYIKGFASIISEQYEVMYKSQFIRSNILFSFKPLKSIQNTKYENFNLLEDKNKDYIKKVNDIKNFKYKDYSIPSTMDLTLWPGVKLNDDYTSSYCDIKIKMDENNYYFVDVLSTIHDKSITHYIKNKGTLLVTIEDTMLNPYNLAEIKRVVTENNNKNIYFLFDGKVQLHISQKSTAFISPINRDINIEPKFLTLDFETRDIPIELENNTNDKINYNNVIAKKIPISVSVYDGKKTYSDIFKNIYSWNEDLCLFIKKNLMKRKFDYYKVYVHNFSYFDAIFLIDCLSILGEVKPVFRENKILKLTFTFKIKDSDKRVCRLIFYDSNLIFQTSLRKLSKSFKIDNEKTFFPYGFMNDTNLNFNYNGEVPDIQHFLNTISEDDYKKYKDKFKNKKWNLSKELIKYCENDTISLYQIINKFHNEIYSLFRIDISKYPTLPSIAFAIYRTNFIYKYRIPKILGKLHYTLKESYYGGICEAYKPKGGNIHSYDVNSLYPYSMFKFDMPVGVPRYFWGDVKLLGEGEFPFGFYRVKVNAPTTLKCPALPLRYNINSSKRTLFPVGIWEGWYFSEEIKDKIKQGYSFEIIEGYLFEKQNIFKNYIEVLYKIKASHSSDDPKYFISKLLMNSLYGRFGLNPETRKVVIVSDDESEKYILEKENVIVTPLLSGKVMLSYNSHNTEDLNMNDISVPIASAISAYSRVTMNKFLIKYSENIFAIDTDGIKVNKELDLIDIDNKELGKMKYEYTLNEGIFPAPKVYGGVLKEPYKSFNKELVKIKGVKNLISYETLKPVLSRNEKLIINQEKWLRRLDNSTILVKNEDYTLEVKDSKRELIYNPWGDLVATLPFKLTNDGIELRGGSPYYIHLKNPYVFNV